MILVENLLNPDFVRFIDEILMHGHAECCLHVVKLLCTINATDLAEMASKIAATIYRFVLRQFTGLSRVLDKALVCVFSLDGLLLMHCSLWHRRAYLTAVRFTQDCCRQPSSLALLLCATCTAINCGYSVPSNGPLARSWFFERYCGPCRGNSQLIMATGRDQDARFCFLSVGQV